MAEDEGLRGGSVDQAEGENDLRGNLEVLAGGDIEAGRRPAQVAQLDAVARRELDQLRVVVQELVQTVLDVEPLGDRRLQQLAPGRRGTAAPGGDADERGGRVEAERVVDRRHDRDAVLRLARPGGVEDRHGRVGRVPDDAPCGLAVVRVVGAALSEDQVPLLAPLAGSASRRAKRGSAAAFRCWRPGALRARVAHTVPSGPEPPAAAQERERARTPSPGASGGSWTPSTSSTPGHGSSARSRLPSRSTWSNRLA